MSTSILPSVLIWQLTYACQLRCTHCCTESGRRAARKLPRERMLRVADIVAAMRPLSVSLCGGEPLLVPELFEIADRLRAAGMQVRLVTNGIGVTEEKAGEITRRFTHAHVSVDGATAAVHDRIRGYPGAFEATMRSLEAIDRATAAQAPRTEERFHFGVDVTVVQSNFAELELFCTTLAPRLPELSFLEFGAAIPGGLASRAGYAEHELLTEEQLAAIRDPGLSARLRALAPRSVKLVELTDNFVLQMHPERVRNGTSGNHVMEIEPDGGVRGTLFYEGTVGNILEEPPEVLWRRAQEQRSDPFIVREISNVRTMKEWAAAARRIDRHFASGDDLLRLASRREYVP